MSDKKQHETRANAGAAGSQRRKRWTVLKIIELALMAIGLVFVGIYVAARVETHFASRAAIERFKAAGLATADPQAALQEQEIPKVEPSFDGWSKERIEAYTQAAELQKSVPAAVLEISRIQLEAPVFEGTDALTLNHAVGHITETARPGEPGNIGLAGHRDGFFRKLKGIRTGDQIDLMTRTGTDRYTVDRIEVVSPHEVRVLQAGDRSSLTLVTCYPFYFIGGAPRRFVVKAYLTQHISAGTSESESRLNTQPTNPSQED